MVANPHHLAGGVDCIFWTIARSFPQQGTERANVFRVVGADLPLPRCLRQLVQPHRRSRRPDPIVGRWRRQRYWEAGLGRALGRTACS